MGDEVDVDQDLDLQEGGDIEGEGGDGAGHSGDEPPEPQEPFLKVDDRTVYKDRDAALKGFQDTKGYLARYQALGKPEDLARVREENQRLRMALMGGDGSLTAAEQDELDKLIQDPDLRKKWRDSEAPVVALGRKHFITKEELAEQRDKQFRAATHLEFDELGEVLDQSGVKLDKRMRGRLEAIALHAMGDKDDPLGERLVNAYNANDPKRFVRELIRDSYGEDALKGKKQSRTPDGKFAAGARLEQAGQKASQLPKAPPDGGGAAGGAGSPQQLPDLRNGSRLNVAKAKWAEIRARMSGA